MYFDRRLTGLFAGPVLKAALRIVEHVSEAA
jgi:hypothetical protein